MSIRALFDQVAGIRAGIAHTQSTFKSTFDKRTPPRDAFETGFVQGYEFVDWMLDTTEKNK